MQPRTSRPRPWAVVGAAIGAGLVAAWGAGIGALSAQEATPDIAASADRSAQIRGGDCGDGDLGETVAPLTELTVPEGEGVGQVERAVPAESAFTSVPLPLAAIVGEEHAIVVLGSTDDGAPAIACGEVGGIADEAGSLVIGLGEVAGSGYSGIAFLSAGGDGVSTDVSLFVAGGLGGEPAGDAAGEREPGATPEA